MNFQRELGVLCEFRLFELELAERGQRRSAPQLSVEHFLRLVYCQIIFGRFGDQEPCAEHLRTARSAGAYAMLHARTILLLTASRAEPELAGASDQRMRALEAERSTKMTRRD